MKALQFYELARRRDCAKAYARVAEYCTWRYLNPSEDTDPEEDKTMAFCFTKEAEQLERIEKVKKRGYLTGGDGSFALGSTFEAGVICPQSLQLALHFYLVSAREGNYQAWKRIMRAYTNGELGLTHFVPSARDRDNKAVRIFEFIKTYDRSKRFQRRKLPTLFAHPGMTEGHLDE